MFFELHPSTTITPRAGTRSPSGVRDPEHRTRACLLSEGYRPTWAGLAARHADVVRDDAENLTLRLFHKSLPDRSGECPFLGHSRNGPAAIARFPPPC